MRIDALIFDLDNTLWDVEPVILRAEERLAEFLAQSYPRVLERHTLATMRELRTRLVAEVGRRGGQVFFPDLEFCTDNGAMIALVGALRLSRAVATDFAFSVRPRWDLATLPAV